MKRSAWLAYSILLMCVLAAASTVAHEVRPALLKISEVSDQKFLVSWKVPALGNRRLAIAPEFAAGFSSSKERVSGFSSGASIQSWYIAGRELTDTDIVFTNLSSTMTDVLVQVSFQDGRYQTELVRPSAPVFHVSARDSHFKVFQSYMELGIEHILLGWDHLLFVLGMILLVTGKRRLLWAVTGFTVAHSITLVLATLDIIHVPAPLVEAIIALSIVLLAVEVTKYRQTGVETFALRSPWIISIVIGLVHGLGFAGALSDFGLPVHARVTSLLAFNLGVEFGQLLFIVLLMFVAVFSKRLKLPFRQPIRFATTWLIGLFGAFWLVQRTAGIVAL